MERRFSGLQRALNAISENDPAMGEGVDAVAKLANLARVTRKTILNWLREDGTPLGAGGPLPDNKVTEAAAKAGGVPTLARALGVTPQAVREWVRLGYVPPKRAQEIELRYGVPRTELVSAKVRNALGLGGEL